jgi:GDYXXLXY protein
MKLPTAPVRIVAAGGLLAATLIGLVVREGVGRARGQEAIVEIAGYDPRALLTGHYVQFQIRSERPPATACPPGSQADVLQARGWVALAREGERHVATGMAPTRAAALRLGQVAARGRLVCERATSFRPVQAQSGPPPEVMVISLYLGVDRFHADQAQAEAMQKQLQARDGGPAPAFAVLSVDRAGTARLKGLVIGGVRTDLDWF